MATGDRIPRIVRSHYTKARSGGGLGKAGAWWYTMRAAHFRYGPKRMVAVAQWQST